jgi:hypothetical protein
MTLLRLFIRFEIIILLLVLLASNTYANPWNFEKGAGQFISTYRYYATTGYFDIDGERRPKFGTFNKNELQLSADYGVAKKWNIGAEIFASRQSDEQNGSNIIEFTGISRADLRASYQLYRDAKYALAIQPSISLPPYYIKKYYAGGNPTFEHGAAALALATGYNFNFMSQNHWLASRLAYRHRLGDKLYDQYHLSAQAGLRVNDIIAFIPELNYTGLISSQKRAFNGIAGDNNYELLNAQLSVAYSIKPNTTLQIGAFRHLLGNNAGAGGGGIISLWLNW